MTVMKMDVTTDMSQSRFDSLKNYYTCDKIAELKPNPHRRINQIYFQNKTHDTYNNNNNY
jgi:hypothetical protein